MLPPVTSLLFGIKVLARPIGIHLGIHLFHAPNCSHEQICLQDGFWKFATNKWASEEVNAKNIHGLAEAAASEYLAGLSEKSSKTS